ncbi:hypothetical protein G9A89_012434 [Geosiphon pyriformis]|nr:hypothetical protein G9A89_012434 [Geosiphon pyriformis]
MESFELDKDHTIKSVLECSFHKVVLDYLVMGDKLILEPDLVKPKVDKIMEEWTRKHRVPLNYMFNGAFSGVMCPIGFDKMSAIVKELPDGKAAGLSGISNELWKQYDKSVLDMLLVLLNFCLVGESRVLMNTCPIVLIEMAHKIFSKVLSDRISSACSMFNVLHGNNFSVLKNTFAYLVSAVLFPIVCYRMQFSYVPLSVCNKWDAMIYKDLKSKTGLPFDFSNDTLHYLSLYSLRTFEQIQAESKLASVLNWHPHHPLQFPVCIKVCPINNFLAGVAHILFGCDLSLGGFFLSTFRFCGGSPMSLVLGKHCFSKYVFLLCHYSVAFMEQLRNWAIPLWFDLFVQFLGSVVSSSSVCLLSMDGHALSDVLQSHNFGVVCDALLNTNADVSLSVYMNRSLSGLGTVSMKAGAAAFFKDIHLVLDVRVSDMVSLMLVKLQAIALALECIPLFCSIDLFLDSQVALNAYESESLLICPDFRNQCWIKHCHITDVIWNKNLNINWVKIKSHSGVSSNEQADALAKVAASSSWWLPYRIGEHFLRDGGSVVSGNLRHFVGSGSQVVIGGLRGNIDWSKSSLVAQMVGLRTYFMKALHHQLPVVMYKHLYDRHYPSMLLSTCAFDIATGAALYKGFVFRDWYQESVSTFKNPKVVATNIVNFVCDFCIAFWDDIWLVYVKHHAVMERNGLILHDDSIPVSVSGFSECFLSGIVRLLGVAKAFGIGFGFCKSYLFFSGTCNKVLVHIGV